MSGCLALTYITHAANLEKLHDTVKLNQNVSKFYSRQGASNFNSVTASIKPNTGNNSNLQAQANKSILSLAPTTYSANEMAHRRAKCLSRFCDEPEITEDNGSANAVRTQFSGP